MGRDQLQRMDVDTGWVYHRHWRAIQREDPEGWPIHAVAWFAVLGESWKVMDRVTLEDAWPTALAYPINLTRTILTRHGLLDKAGKIPRESWAEWIGPTLRRMAAGQKGAAVRWGGPSHSGGNATAMPIASQPASQPAKKSRVRAEGANGAAALVDMKQAMAAAGFDVEKLPKPGKPA